MKELSPVDWAKRPLQHYADFEGRSPRSEYWWFQLFQWLAYVGLSFVFGILGAIAGMGIGLVFAVIILLAIGLFIPNLACMIRRLHDQDHSGWMCLLFFIPYVGGIVAIVFMCIRGTQGANKYGPDPLSEEHLEEVFA